VFLATGRPRSGDTGWAAALGQSPPRPTLKDNEKDDFHAKILPFLANEQEEFIVDRFNEAEAFRHLLRVMAVFSPLQCTVSAVVACAFFSVCSSRPSNATMQPPLG
jgi:hypothetical protein